MPQNVELLSNTELLKVLNPQIKVDDKLSYNVLDELHYYSKLSHKPFLVSFTDNQDINGFLLVHGVTMQLAWLRRLYIHPKYRGKGIVKSLLKGGLHLASSRGFSKTSGLISERFWNIGLFQSLGFKAIQKVNVLHITKNE